MQKDLTIEKYIELLSSEKAMPGGGSAAALVSAIGNALCGMVFSLTVNKKNFLLEKEEIKEKIKNSHLISNNVAESLMKSMDEDGQAFEGILKCFKLPKDTEENIEYRKNKIQDSYKVSLLVPLNLAEKSMSLYQHIYISCKYGNKNLISDAGVAAILIHAAIESAIINVKVNLAGIKDEVYKNEILERINEILVESENEKRKLMNLVTTEIGL